MIFLIGMEQKQYMNDSTKQELIKQNIQRLIQLEPNIHGLIGALDLGISNVYDYDETIEIATVLSDTLGQMDSDLTALINLLDQ